MGEAARKLDTAERDFKPHEMKFLRTLAQWKGPELPTLSNLAGALGLSGESSVRKTMVPLEECGMIERRAMGPGLPKVPQLTPRGYSALGLEPRPRVLEIRNRQLENPIPVVPASCGPLKPVEEPAFHIEWLGDIFHNYRYGDLLLVAVGDSMVSPDSSAESIADGDRCLLRPGIWPGPGEVVFVEYVLENGLSECTLKEWHQDEHRGIVRLVPRNPEFVAIERDIENVIVHGVVLEILRLARSRVSTHANAHASTHTNGHYQ